jgi:acetyl-CoA decarbonylase/synthase complex subunit epsilon
MSITPWQLGNVPGPKTALKLTGEVAGKLLKKAKNPLIIVGAEALKVKVGEKLLLDYVIEIAEVAKIPIVATSSTLSAFLERGVEPALSMGAIEITDRLRDPEWSLDGSKPHDIVVYVGITYQLQSQLLSCLKNFAPQIRTLSLDRYYHPNATWSFQNLSEKDWIENLNILMKTLKEEKKKD